MSLLKVITAQGMVAFSCCWRRDPVPGVTLLHQLITAHSKALSTEWLTSRSTVLL